LLFVPAGTGVILHLQLVAEEWLPLTLSVLISTFVTLLVTALLMKLTLGKTVHERPQS
jgi:holin-like protein